MSSSNSNNNAENLNDLSEQAELSSVVFTSPDILAKTTNNSSHNLRRTSGGPTRLPWNFPRGPGGSVPAIPGGPTIVPPPHPPPTIYTPGIKQPPNRVIFPGYATANDVIKLRTGNYLRNTNWQGMPKDFLRFFSENLQHSKDFPVGPLPGKLVLDAWEKAWKTYREQYYPEYWRPEPAIIYQNTFNRIVEQIKSPLKPYVKNPFPWDEKSILEEEVRVQPDLALSTGEFLSKRTAENDFGIKVSAAIENLDQVIGENQVTITEIGQSIRRLDERLQQNQNKLTGAQQAVDAYSQASAELLAQYRHISAQQQALRNDLENSIVHANQLLTQRAKLLELQQDMFAVTGSNTENITPSEMNRRVRQILSYYDQNDQAKISKLATETFERHVLNNPNSVAPELLWLEAIYDGALNVSNETVKNVIQARQNPESDPEIPEPALKPIPEAPVPNQPQNPFDVIPGKFDPDASPEPIIEPLFTPTPVPVDQTPIAKKQNPAPTSEGEDPEPETESEPTNNGSSGTSEAQTPSSQGNPQTTSTEPEVPVEERPTFESSGKPIIGRELSDLSSKESKELEAKYVVYPKSDGTTIIRRRTGDKTSPQLHVDQGGMILPGPRSKSTRGYANYRKNFKNEFGEIPDEHSIHHGIPYNSDHELVKEALRRDPNILDSINKTDNYTAVPRTEKAYDDNGQEVQNLKEKGKYTKLIHNSSHEKLDEAMTEKLNFERDELNKSYPNTPLKDLPNDAIFGALKSAIEEMRQEMQQAADDFEKGNFEDLPDWVNIYQFKDNPNRDFPRLNQTLPDQSKVVAQTPKQENPEFLMPSPLDLLQAEQVIKNHKSKEPILPTEPRVRSVVDNYAQVKKELMQQNEKVGWLEDQVAQIESSFLSRFFPGKLKIAKINLENAQSRQDSILERFIRFENAHHQVRDTVQSWFEWKNSPESKQAEVYEKMICLPEVAEYLETVVLITDCFTQWQCCNAEAGCFKQVPIQSIHQRFENYLTTGEISEDTLIAMQEDLQKQEIFELTQSPEIDMAMAIGEG